MSKRPIETEADVDRLVKSVYDVLDTLTQTMLETVGRLLQLRLADPDDREIGSLVIELRDLAEDSKLRSPIEMLELQVRAEKLSKRVDALFNALTPSIAGGNA